MKISLAISGELGLVCFNKLMANNNIIAVYTDKNSLAIIDFCHINSIPCFVGNPRNGKHLSFSHSLNEYDILFSINYLFLIEDDLISRAKMFALNIHGSLLPLYRGRTPHVWAIINGEQEVGITIHKIDKGCDTGDVLLQLKIPIHQNTTGGDVLERYKNEYPELVLKSIDMILKNQFSFIPQNHSIATFYGKRTADDGEILWHWEAQQIMNWVRAQTRPYPGAFSKLADQKIVIWNLRKYENLDLDPSIKVGKFFKFQNLILVKCSDSFLEITDYSFDKKIEDFIKE